jgi:hypothetical protein
LSENVDAIEFTGLGPPAVSASRALADFSPLSAEESLLPASISGFGYCRILINRCV